MQLTTKQLTAINEWVQRYDFFGPAGTVGMRGTVYFRRWKEAAWFVIGRRW